METIPNGTKLLLDTVVVVYFLEQHPAYGALAKDIFYRIELGELQGLMANLVFVELLVPLHRRRDYKTAEGLIDR